MESIASTSTPSHHPRRRHRFSPTPPLAERVVRAVTHRLRLVHRSDSIFYILGATGNVYNVNISATPSCSCPDRTTPCKHILFVYIRVLSISLEDSCLWRRSLRPCQVERLLGLPMSSESLAGPSVRERFHQLFFSNSTKKPTYNLEVGTTCPVCLEEMAKEEKLLACGTCRNLIHEECMNAWKRSSRRRSTSCVVCRARWRSKDREEQENYLNLSAYVGAEDDMALQGDGHCTSN